MMCVLYARVCVTVWMCIWNICVHICIVCIGI